MNKKENDIVLFQGEVQMVLIDNKYYGYKLGDGIHKLSELEYLKDINMEDEMVKLTDVINKKDIRICQKYDTEENWNSSNPILLKGEMVFVESKGLDNKSAYKIKVGDGKSHYRELPYIVNTETIDFLLKNNIDIYKTVDQTIDKIDSFNDFKDEVNIKLNHLTNAIFSAISIYVATIGALIIAFLD